jgi:multiple sugar transport system substrate-binding protein
MRTRRPGSIHSPRRSPSLRRAVRRVGVLLACLTAAATALTACSSDDGDSSDGGEVTLSYGIWDAAQKPAMEQIVSEFHKDHPDINVKIQVTPWDDYWTKLQTAATGGSAPDVFWMTLAYFQYYADGGALLPLDDQIAEDGVDMSSFVPAIADGYKFDDKTYGMPKDVNAFGLFYNKLLFEDAGVQLPDDSWTWDDVIEAAQDLTDPAEGVYGIAAPEADEATWYLTVPQAGGYVISEDGTESGYDLPETIKGIEFWEEMVNKYHVSPDLQQLTDTDPLTMFTSGKVAMYYGGSWDPVAIADVPAAKAFTAVVPLPDDVTSNYYSNGLANSIFADTDHPEEAWEFVKFLGSKEANEIQATTGTVIPAYEGQAGEYVKSMPWLDAQSLVDQLPNALPFPNSLNTPEWRDFATEEFAKAWTGEESVEEAAHIVADHMNEVLAEEQE